MFSEVSINAVVLSGTSEMFLEKMELKDDFGAKNNVEIHACEESSKSSWKKCILKTRYLNFLFANTYLDRYT